MKIFFFLSSLVVILHSSILLASELASEQYLLKNKCDELVFRGAQNYLIVNDDELACPKDSCIASPAKIKSYLDSSVKTSAKTSNSAYQKFLANPFMSFNYNPWKLSKMTHTSYREMGLFRIFANIPLYNYPIDPKDDLKTIYQKMLDSFSLFSMLKFEKEVQPYGPDNREIIKMLNEYKGSSGGETSIYANLMNTFGICSLFTPTNALACTANVNRLIFKLKSGDDRFALGEPFLKDILTSKNVARGARRAAEKIFKKFIDKKTGGDIFSDIYTSFIEEGFKIHEAKKWTWDLIFLSFVHGQNGYTLAQTYTNKNNFWTFRSAQLISSTAVYLDSLNIQHNLKMYSLPEHIEVSCDNGKPYHFWVPAYLARQSRSLGFSKEVSKSSSFLLELGYQLFSKSQGRWPPDYLAQGVLGASNLKNRLDLSYAAAGVEFGIEGKKVKFSIDKSFDKSLNKSFKQVTTSDQTPYQKKEMMDTLNLFLMMNPWTIYSGGKE